MEAMKLDEQAQQYLDSNGNLDHYSLGRLCISTKAQIDEAIAVLQSWNKMSLIKGRRNPIQLIFNEIMKLAPLYLYQILKEHESLIRKYLAYEFQATTGIDSNGEVELMLITLDDYSTLFPNAAVSTYVMVINHKVVLGYLQFLDHNYLNAIAHFEWVLNFFDAKLKRLNFIKEKTTSLSSVTQSVITVLLCRCYDFGGIPCDNKRLNELFLSFVNATRIRSKSEYLCGRLSIYFVSFGILHEFGAINEASKVVIENDRREVVTIAYRLEQNNLEEMIRKYILAVTNKAHDDPSTNILYDRIIWGILLCGGIHLKTLWFFILLKNYFFVEADFGPLHIFPDLGYKIFATDDILSQYENAWELIDKVYNLYTTLSSAEKSTIWDPENGNLFLTPQIFDAGDKLLLTDLFYDENLRNTSPSFILDSQYQLRQKLKGHIKLQGRIISDRIELSKDLISLWYNNYEECHGSVPSIVADFLIED